MKWDFALGERKIGYRRHQYGAAWNERKHHQWVCWPNKKISGWIYRVVFLLVPPSFRTKNKTSKQPIAAFVIGWLAVFFFVLKFGGTSEKNCILIYEFINIFLTNVIIENHVEKKSTYLVQYRAPIPVEKVHLVWAIWAEVGSFCSLLTTYSIQSWYLAGPTVM